MPNFAISQNPEYLDKLIFIMQKLIKMQMLAHSFKVF